MSGWGIKKKKFQLSSAGGGGGVAVAAGGAGSNYDASLTSQPPPMQNDEILPVHNIKQEKPTPSRLRNSQSQPDSRGTRSPEEITEDQPNHNGYSPKKSYNSYLQLSIQELEEKIKELEIENERLRVEKEDALSTLNQTYENIGNYEEQIRNTRDENRVLSANNRAFQIEKEMLIQQINESFADESQLSNQYHNLTGQTLKDEYDKLLQQIKETLDNVNNLHIENQQLTTVLQKTNKKIVDIQEEFDRQSSMIQKAKDEEINRLNDELENLKEIWRSALNHQNKLQMKYDKLKQNFDSDCKSIDLFTTPDPQLAVQQLKEHSNPQFMFNCTTLQQKKDLLETALKSEDPEIVTVVIRFLQVTLTPALFDEVVLPSPEAVKYYLKFLLDNESFYKNLKGKLHNNNNNNNSNNNNNNNNSNNSNNSTNNSSNNNSNNSSSNDNESDDKNNMTYINIEISKQFRKEWKRVLLITNRHEEYGRYLYSRAMQEKNSIEKKHTKLQKCLKFGKEHNCLKHHIQEIVQHINQLSMSN